MSQQRRFHLSMPEVVICHLCEETVARILSKLSDKLPSRRFETNIASELSIYWYKILSVLRETWLSYPWNLTTLVSRCEWWLISLRWMSRVRFFDAHYIRACPVPSLWMTLEWRITVHIDFIRTASPSPIPTPQLNPHYLLCFAIETDTIFRRASIRLNSESVLYCIQ